MTKIIGIIPARYASSRFPGKPLAMLGNQTIISKVYQQCEKSKLLADVCVATDHPDIYNHIKQINGNVVMTSTNHHNGTDRCYEALKLQPNSYDYLVNIQGDEPFVKPEQIDELCQLLDNQVKIATLGKVINDAETLWNLSEVKIIVNQLNNALYFSRAVIPHQTKDIPKQEWHKHYNYLKHIGIYAYQTRVLSEIIKLPQADLEQHESLEQLRWLANGYDIKIGMTSFETFCIDTPEDLERAKKMMNKKEYKL